MHVRCIYVCVHACMYACMHVGIIDDDTYTYASGECVYMYVLGVHVMYVCMYVCMHVCIIDNDTNT